MPNTGSGTTFTIAERSRSTTRSGRTYGRSTQTPQTQEPTPGPSEPPPEHSETESPLSESGLLPGDLDTDSEEERATQPLL